MPTELLPVLPLLSFITSALVVLALFPPRREAVRARLAPYGAPRPPRAARERFLSGSFGQRVLGPAFRSILDVLSRTAPTSIRQEAALQIARAGNPIGVDLYLAIRGLAMVGLPLGYVAFMSQTGRALDPLGLVIVAGLFLGGRRGTAMWLQGRIGHRQREIERALPSALDLITVCMEAGLSFDAGLAKIVEKTHGPLSEEFGRVLQEMQIGKSRRVALHDLSQRCQVRDLAGFVAAVVQADQMGMSLSPVMRAQADEVRTRRRQRAEELAMKASVKMLFPLIFCILPATVLVVLGPGVVTLFRDIFTQMGSLS